MGEEVASVADPFADGETIALLLDLLHQDSSRFDRGRLLALDADRWARLLSLAAEQRVRPLLYRRLKGEGLLHQVPSDVRAELHECSRRVAIRTMHFYRETARIAADLSTQGVDVMVLKGLHLARVVYRDTSLREMWDMDLMVRVEHLPRAEAVLRARGYNTERPTAVAVTTAVTNHLPLFVRGGGSIEVHWNLTRPGQEHSIDPDELWRRAGEIEIAGQRVLALAAEDLLLHLCEHASYHHQFLLGLYPLCDIAALIHHLGSHIDWTVVCRRAEAWGWQRGAYLCLRLAHELVGAAVPAGVLDRLRPAGMSTEVAEAARYLVFVPRKVGESVPLAVAGRSGERPLWREVRRWWSRVFVSPAHIAYYHGLPRWSPWIPLYYLVRFKDILVRSGGFVLGLSAVDAGLKQTARQKHLLRHWLSAPARDDEQPRYASGKAQTMHHGV